MRAYISLLVIWVVGEISHQSFSFIHNPSIVRNTALLAKKSHPEYTIDDDESDTAETVSVGSGDYFSVTLPKEEPEKPSKNPTQKPEYGALSQGTVVQIQVGDIALARKAWKKRRRTGSPLLVPCSVLNVDRQSMARWNMIYLLEKFGRSQKDGIEISASDMANKYRTHLKSSLQKQADALSYSSNNEMIRELFNKKTQESYGIRLVENDDQVFLKAPISKNKAHKRTAKTPILQFRLPKKGDHGDDDTLTHTGYLRTRKEDSEDREYGFLPLSAALRVSQKDDVDTGRVEEGSIHPAVVFDYDAIGDGGSPLLTLSLNPRGTRDTLKVKPDRKFMPIEEPKCMFNELAVGQGPYRAKVIQLLPGRALVDMQVGRQVSSEGMVNVLGTLRFRDSVEPDQKTMLAAKHQKWLLENQEEDDYEDDSESVIAASLEDLDTFDFDDEDFDDEDEDFDEEGDLAEQLLALRDSSSFEEGTFEEGEEEEDISDLFQANADGSIIFTDPDTGKPILLNSDDEEEEEEEAPKGFGSKKVKKGPVTKKRNIKIMSQHAAEQPQPRLVSKHLTVGDVVDVYIRTVSKQSGQFSVTTNPAVQGRKAKDMKKENDAAKKLKRLKKSLGGDLHLIYELEGSECDGIVKAASKTGDWVYVEPNIDGLPVGVAAMGEKLSVNSGDKVRVRIEGVDEERGQLALQVLEKQ